MAKVIGGWLAACIRHQAAFVATIDVLLMAAGTTSLQSSTPPVQGWVKHRRTTRILSSEVVCAGAIEDNSYDSK